MNVVWTSKAEQSFYGVLDFLIHHWTETEAGKFIELVDKTIQHIQRNPVIFQVSSYDSRFREAVITKHTTLFYRILESTIEVSYFWGNFQNPDRINQILK